MPRSGAKLQWPHRRSLAPRRCCPGQCPRGSAPGALSSPGTAAGGRPTGRVRGAARRDLRRDDGAGPRRAARRARRRPQGRSGAVAAGHRAQRERELAVAVDRACRRAPARRRGAPGAPKASVSRIEPAKRCSCCSTTPSWARSAGRSSWVSSRPSNAIWPDCGANKPSSSLPSVDLPEPELPTIATFAPAGISMEMSERTCCPPGTPVAPSCPRDPSPRPGQDVSRRRSRWRRWSPRSNRRSSSSRSRRPGWGLRAHEGSSLSWYASASRRCRA